MQVVASSFRLLCLTLAAVCLFGCHAKSGSELRRRGDEIVVCGRYFHTGAPVVLWTDPGGYDAYRTEKRFVPWERAEWTPPTAEKKADGPSTPNRYSIRFASRVGQPDCPLTPEDFERIRGGGWDVPTLQKCVDQFVLHYDVCGTSRQCFRVLHDMRGLSVHFMLDIDGTIYQTLDLKERAWHATVSNDRSIGIEIANIGAYPRSQLAVLDKWYEPGASWWLGGQAEGSATASSATGRITIPPQYGDGGVRIAGTYSPASERPAVGNIQGQELVMFDLTPQQYTSLARLTAAICTVFPNIPCDYPRDADGQLVTAKLPDDALRDYRGILGHYHIQANKTDPGPALEWDHLTGEARKRLGPHPR
jgi:N-acetyl-anhydromuramyl-L-alanine amidase AmpD